MGQIYYKTNEFYLIYKKLILALSHLITLHVASLHYIYGKFSKFSNYFKPTFGADLIFQNHENRKRRLLFRVLNLQT